MPATKYNIVKSSKAVKTPAYVKEIYGKIYENEKLCRFLDDDRIVSVHPLLKGQRITALAHFNKRKPAFDTY